MPISRPQKVSTRLANLRRKAHILLRENKYSEAWVPIQEILNIDMDDSQGLYMWGVCMRHTGHYGAAAQLFRRVCALEPREPNSWMHFGAAMHDIHMYDEALEVFQIIEKLIPGDPGVYANMAASYVQKGEFHQGLNYANMALEKKPDYPRALACKGMACLGLERWKEGFKEYKNLYGSQITIRNYCIPEEPEWDGTKGLTVVVQCDQGIGDEIRYASMLHELAKDCKQVLLDCHPKLVNVFKRSFPEIQVYGTKKLKQGIEWPLEYKIDARTHISGLGQFYRQKSENFPRKPYLVPNEDLRLKWREKLKDLERPLVGLAWQGGTSRTGRELRSTLLSQWKPLVECGGTFVDMSYHDSKDEAEAFGLYRPDINHDDYDDTLALIAELDLIVCVPTTVIHAAGSIGKPVWVMVPPYPSWEFGLYRDDMIWYEPGLVKLYRAKDFNETIDLIAIDYATSFHRPRPTPTTSLHSASKLDHPKGEQAGSDHTPRIATITHY